ncbi:MAG TPA: ArsR family transcriptional regulator [Anaerolineae bacterium]|nr:ArsR family transcriptional regulator [Anaerolineae bacterium]
MEPQPEILSFVKAMSSAERLRIVGLLSQGPKRAVDVASALGVHASDVMRHLEQLTATGVVTEADSVYELDEKAIESLARGQFEARRPVYDANEEDEDIRKMLNTFLLADGTLKQIPPLGKKLLIIMNFLVHAFDFDATYTEKEVNIILRRFHVDTAALRRYLVDYGLMERESDGTKYWRVRGGTK